MRFNSKKSVFTFLLLIIVISLIGCSQRQLTEQNGMPNTNPNNIDIIPGTRNDNAGNMGNTDNLGITRLGDNRGNVNNAGENFITGNRTGMNNTNINKSQNIVRQLEARNDIERASCVISGNTALVAVDVKKDRTIKSKNIKNDITNIVKNIEPGLTNVAVTEEPDLFERVRKLSDDMEKGKTMQGLGKEFNNLLNRIIPAAR